MSTSTLDIHQRLLDAAAAVQATVMPRLDAGDLEDAAATAIDVQILVDVSQAIVAIGDSLDEVVDSCHDGVIGVMSSLSETAVAAAATVLQEVPSELRGHGDTLTDAGESLQSEVEAFDAEVIGSSDLAVESHDEFGKRLQALDTEYSDRYEQLGEAFSAFGGELEQQLKTDLSRRADEWMSVLEELRSHRLENADGKLREAFAHAADQYMDLVENVSQLYRDAAQSAATSLGRLADEGITGTLEASVERLKDKAIALLENEVAEAITESGLSVTLTSALSPVMPQLIAFYKAVTLLEEAIRVYKELKSAFGG
jgi:F0F1-type ATP synthase membrane subunit b/b'